MQELLSKRLRHRVRVLGDLLGQTISAQMGDEFLQTIEEIRLLAKTRRQQGTGDHQKLLEVLAEQNDDELIGVARAFNQFLNLTNIAEQADATEVHKDKFPDDSHLSRMFETLKANNIDPAVIADAIKQDHCDLVLTAHPTEITRRTLIQKYNRIADRLDQVDEDVPMRAADRIELERLIAEVWHTDEIRTERPTPQDEAIWGYAVIEHSFWQAIPELWEGLDRLLFKHTGESLPLSCAPIKISSWMGGDRDGNPNVTSAVTEAVMRLARWMAADLYLRDVEELLSQLSMSRCNSKIAALSNNESHEPYRVVLRKLRQRLRDTRTWAEGNDDPHRGLVLYRKELIDPLLACYNSLHECGMGVIADGLLKQTLIRAHTFGVNLVDLDIRQNADKHIDLLDALTKYLHLGSYAEWSEKARHDFILDELESKRPLIPESWEPPGEPAETLRTLRLIANARGEGISSYIISMAKKPSDVLAVVMLLRKCGLKKPLPVVPLFETLEDLENAGWTLERLLRTKWYAKYIKGHQQIMIGYSDSAKDAGQMAAAWAQYRAQEDLVIISEQYKIELALFHGRGGAAGRGGGPVRQAILSQPPGAIKHGMRITEQGEMIRFKYGSPSLALNSMDLMLSAAIEASLIPPPRPLENWRFLMDKLSLSAKNTYRGMVQDNPDFVDYFTQGTPERELALLALGSRPVRRGNQQNQSISSLRAIPWVFAWTQKRLMLPAWYGTDSAFSDDLTEKDWQIIDEMYRQWPFFQTQMDMLEMVLSKADAEISSRYDEVLLEPGLIGIGDHFREQLGLLIASVNRIKGQQELLEKTPAVRRTIDLRDPYTDPLHFLQIELISRYRNSDDSNERVKKALLITIAGIAASMRNTG